MSSPKKAAIASESLGTPRKLNVVQSIQALLPDIMPHHNFGNCSRWFTYEIGGKKYKVGLRKLNHFFEFRKAVRPAFFFALFMEHRVNFIITYTTYFMPAL